MTTGLRETGIDVLGKVPWGKHFCLFYETKEDLLDTVVPYFRAGLENNEFCLWIISELLTEEEARNALSQAVPAFDQYLTNRSIEFIPSHKWYLKGGSFDSKRVIDDWHEKLRGALSRGYDGMRVSGDTFWVNTTHWKDFYSYEREIDESIDGLSMTALCTYPLAACRSEDILDVARAHQFTAVRRNGAWEIVEAADTQTETHTLTPREIEVLTWVARGKSAKEIAQILKISKRTVDEHTQDAIRRLGAANRTQAVAIALREHIISV